MTEEPSLAVERSLLNDRLRFLAAMDEVGRGALAGPVSVGVVLIDSSVLPQPAGVRDSKLLSANTRQVLAPLISEWALDCAVGHATAAEIDDVGIIAALRLAGSRALAGLSPRPQVILLDGSHDWLTDPLAVGLFAAPDRVGPEVVTRVRADLECAAVAAASVLAKVERDEQMSTLALAHPGFGWAANKGYASAEHQRALAQLGPSEQHRRSWRLPGVSREQNQRLGRKDEFRGSR